MIDRNVAQRVIEQYGTNDLKTIVEKEGLQVRTRHPWPARFEDCYVSPIIFVPRCDELRHATGALAVAWEGAGGARAARFSGVPFLEVRGISDLADDQAVQGWEQNIPAAMKNVATVLDALSQMED